MEPVITHESDFHSVKIFINGILHIHFLREYYRGFQSYIKGSKMRFYYVEINMTEAQPLILEYERKKMWKQIVEILEKLI